MNRRAWLCLLPALCLLCDPAFARPAAFGDLAPAEAATAAAESGRAVVIFQHDRDSLASEIMRTRVWTDPEVERWIDEHAVGVWIEYQGRASLRLPWNAFSSIQHHGRPARSAEVFMGPECLLGWLSSPGDVPHWQRTPRPSWREAEAAIAELIDPLTKIDHSAEARLLEIWRNLPDLIDDGWFRRSAEPWNLPLVRATRRAVQEHPSARDALAELADELESGLADRRDAIDRWRWLLIVSGVFGDDARTTAWLEHELAAPDRFAEGAMLAMYTEPILERAGRWDLLIRSMDMDELILGAREHRQRILRLQMSLDRLARSPANDRGDDKNAEFARAMRYELRLHLGWLAIGDLDAARGQLEEMQRQLAGHPGAVPWLIGRAADEDLLRGVHLEYLDPNDPEHTAWIERINAEGSR